MCLRQLSDRTSSVKRFCGLLLCKLLAANHSPSLINRNGTGLQSPNGNKGSLSSLVTSLHSHVKLEKLLAAADDAFWNSRKLGHMAGWTLHKNRRSTSSGRSRRSTINMRSCTGEVGAALTATAVRGPLTPEFMQQQLQQLVAIKTGPARQEETTASDAKQSVCCPTPAALSKNLQSTF